MRKFLLLVVLTVFVGMMGGAMAQERTITGKVTSKEDNQPVPGANILVQGTTRGTTSDVDGNFQLALQASDNAIVVSFVGYKPQTIEVGAQTTFNIILESEATNLQEVVVVGYGTQKKSDVTGAVANVKGEELFKQPVLTATQALQGKVAGVQIINSGQPGQSPQFRLRGVSTALGGTTALFVVDGVLTDDISNINTADIVDINILKDASSAAIYGSRGANGVIIITTRNGKSGKIVVNYSNNIGIRQAANLVDMANSAEYANYRQAATGQVAPTPYGKNVSTDWYKTILRNALEQNHNVSISGGSDKSSFLLNAGYMYDQGIVLDNDFKRVTLRLNSDYTLSDYVKVGLQSSYANSINQNGFNNIDIDPNGNVGSVYNDAYRAAPTVPNMVNGLYGNTSVYQNIGNPLLDLNNNSVKVSNNRLQGATYVDVKPVNWLTIRSQFGADWQNSLNRLYQYQFSATDGKTFILPNGQQFNTLSDLSVKNTQSFRWVFNNTATISQKIGNHDFTFLIGATAEKYYQQWFSAYRNSVPADPSLWYIGVGNANSSQNDGGGDESTRNSYLSRLNYSYDGKYLLTATVRRDASSRLAAASRAQYYPSVGLGWVMSRETFFQTVKFIDFLKIRASYGQVGNDQAPTNAFNNSISINKPYPFGGSSTTSTNGSQNAQVIDKKLTWEITREYDLAVEFGLIQNKLTGEINYYDKTVSNALINVPLLASVGSTLGNNVPGTELTNAASINNKGLEISLNWKDNINEDWSYTVSGNVTFNKNTVVALNGGQNIYDGSVGSQGFVTNTDIGHPVGSFYVLKTTGVFNSDAEAASDPTGYGAGLNKSAGYFKYQDTNHDGKIDANDRVFVGSYQPVAYYGISLGLKYKNWDFSTNIYGNAGNKVYNGKRAARVDGRDNIEKALVYNRWTPQNLSQSQPIANIGSLPASTYFVESGSFVRINNVTVGYTFPREMLSRYRISSLRIYATSQNLYTYKKYSGFTAELPGGTTNSGIETSTYPTTRTYSVGLNISF
ncbi:MAG: TonB-dependent receptor [Cyclobacteriaceae bacterium]